MVHTAAAVVVLRRMVERILMISMVVTA